MNRPKTSIKEDDDFINPGNTEEDQAKKDDYDLDAMPPHMKKESKPAKKLSLEARLREIENLGRSIALEAKIQAVAEEITNRMDKLNVAENMEEVADFINPVRVKETRKEIKLLEKKKKMYEKMYKKLTKEDYQAPIVDEELDTEATPEA